MKYIFLLLTILGLTACSDSEQIKKLEYQNSELREQISQQKGVKEAELQALERIVTFSAACDYGISICPESVFPAIKTARNALADGVFPTGQIFWWLVFLKFAVIAAIAGILMGSCRWAWLTISQPAARALEALQTKIESKTKEFEAIQREIHAAKAIETKTRQEVLAQAQAQLQQLERSITQKSKELDDLEKDVATRAVELDGLNADIALKAKEKEFLGAFGSSTRR